MRSHSVTSHLAEVTFPPLPQLKLVLDLATPEGCKAELTWVVGELCVACRLCGPRGLSHLSQFVQLQAFAHRERYVLVNVDIMTTVRFCGSCYFLGVPNIAVV